MRLLFVFCKIFFGIVVFFLVAEFAANAAIINYQSFQQFLSLQNVKIVLGKSVRLVSDVLQ